MAGSVKVRRPKYYYSEEGSLELRELQNFRTRTYLSALVTVLGCLVVLLVANHLFNDFLGIGYNRTKELQHENAALQQKVAELNGGMTELQSKLTQLSTQGDQLRLLVDLPRIDEGSKTGGFGGALSSEDVGAAPDGISKTLQSTASSLQRLVSETKVQTQSYEQILKQYEFNKGYFAALPALKPMDGYYSVNGFGLRMHPVLGLFKTHEGLDIISDVGTPVYAAGDGTVEMAGQSGGGYGIAILINHGYGYQTLYAHLSLVLVHEGQHVKRGDLIAKSGRTGLVTGPHLHYEVRLRGVCQNPVNYFLDDVSAKDYRTSVASR